jgi:hypothetical protein
MKKREMYLDFGLKDVWVGLENSTRARGEDGLLL